MQLTTHALPSFLKCKVNKLLQGTLSPLCGLNQEIGFFSRSSDDPKLITTGVELTGVHDLLNRPDPGKGGYHIGGMGVARNEALIKALGESCERYSQLISPFTIKERYPTQFCSYLELLKKNETPISMEFLNLFSSEQLQRPGFIFDPLNSEKPLLWVQLTAIADQKKYWIPTQLLLVGYNVQKEKGEPWFYSAVTTGTAVHSSPVLAIQNALLELIQIDAAMGHWYGNHEAIEIELDERTAMLKKLIQKYSCPGGIQPIFYWLPSPDLLGFTIACVIYQPKKLPKVVIGLGADTDLIQAMYKSYLEAAGILHLARLCIFREEYMSASEEKANDQNIFDLDSNISYYARGNGLDRIKQKFFSAKKRGARDLPQNLTGNAAEQLKQLIESFTTTGKRLFFMDLTSIELKALQVVSARIWSPDLISLCLPSAVPSNHPRFTKYGGVSHAEPHPYP